MTDSKIQEIRTEIGIKNLEIQALKAELRRLEYENEQILWEKYEV
jgi:hypothetical protein